MEIMGTDETNTVFIGDQLFTDVWGAKRSGDLQYSCEADSSERRDSDRAEDGIWRRLCCISMQEARNRAVKNRLKKGTNLL